jgi:hypothetical protein
LHFEFLICSDGLLNCVRDPVGLLVDLVQFPLRSANESLTRFQSSAKERGLFRKVPFSASFTSFITVGSSASGGFSFAKHIASGPEVVFQTGL